MSLNEDTACAAIMDLDRVRRNICMPRFTPAHWWECDICELTKTGYFREYEVKLTLSDFVADAKKCRQYGDRWTREGRTPPDMRKKHDLLAAGDPRGPTEFSFVAPKGLIPVERLPVWAGLIELSDRGEKSRPTYRWQARVTVKAPRLHKQKAASALSGEVLSSAYYRFHNLLRARIDRTAPDVIWSDPPLIPLA